MTMAFICFKRAAPINNSKFHFGFVGIELACKTK